MQLIATSPLAGVLLLLFLLQRSDAKEDREQHRKDYVGLVNRFIALMGDPSSDDARNGDEEKDDG